MPEKNKQNNRMGHDKTGRAGQGNQPKTPQRTENNEPKKRDEDARQPRNPNQ
ncbi:MAG: hypothetical protein KF824_01160 [Fimbriimonadaceae bacterium]|nr:MAG: hypothetical protein KF824_01160 [Fimbriimonadaceae bacterium]